MLQNVSKEVDYEEKEENIKNKELISNIKKIFTNTGVALALGSASTAYAANTFTFSFVTNVIGTTEFELKKGNTTCGSKAYTYKYDTNSYASFIGNYRIDLDGNGVFEPADGYIYTTDYGDIKKNTYTVNVNTNSDLAPRCLQIRGNGEIIQ